MDRQRLKALFERDMQLADDAVKHGNLDLAFEHLERAHVLGQRWLTRHWRSHWAMLKIARIKSDETEIKGQITRLVGLPFFWIIGWLPKGNTGGANVSPLKPMPYSPEFAKELADYQVWDDILIRFVVLCFGLMIGLVIWP